MSPVPEAAVEAGARELYAQDGYEGDLADGRRMTTHAIYRDKARYALSAALDTGTLIAVPEDPYGEPSCPRCGGPYGRPYAHGPGFCQALGLLPEQEQDGEPLPPHLRDDAPFAVCDACGRKTWATSEFGEQCGMRQPNGRDCFGLFSVPEQEQGAEPQ